MKYLKYYLLPILFQYLVLLARFPRGQLQPVVFSLSCSIRSLRSLANILVVLIRIISKKY
ncbi:hypothetical protein BUZ08_12095 [Staphylococcus gallinarum]|nr:hypothetical protein BUZ08_12095 [Staphylococcus gallinarum]RIO79425.1 hypothetical protein BUZ07_06550 [Staphylococcus gallinarum]